MMTPLILLLLAVAQTAALSQSWLKLPDINPGTFTRRDAASAAAAVSAGAAASPAAASGASKTASSRRAGDIQQWPRIPVWPSWAGGRVIPMGLPNADPFLLVAHHKHWFDPRDPLRGPFRAFGKATGLPYIDVEVESVWKSTSELGCHRADAATEKYRVDGVGRPKCDIHTGLLDASAPRLRHLDVYP